MLAGCAQKNESEAGAPEAPRGKGKALKGETNAPRPGASNEVKNAPVYGKQLEERDGIHYLPGTEVTFTGVAVWNFASGKRKSELTFKDGRKDGPWTKWYEDGKKRAEGTYKDGRGDGLEVYWYSNGKKKEEYNYKDGEADGPATWWLDNGEKEWEATYRAGELIAEKKWDKHGKLISSLGQPPPPQKPAADGVLRAGAAGSEITPPVGHQIQHYFRLSVGVNDPLFARCLYLEDAAQNSLAIICLDLIFGNFELCDELRAEIKKETGIGNTLINFSHSHSSVSLGPRGKTKISNDTDSKWNDATLDKILAIVKEAKERAEPVTLRAGRAQVQVGFNRRLVNKDTGHVYMGVNRKGPSVPWVNVLCADSKESGNPIAVLYETAAHPVIVPDRSKLTSADYPGAAAKRIKETLGGDVVTLFAQGCGGNINGYPLRTTHENARKQGRDLGDAVLKALETSDPIQTETFNVKYTRTSLPSHALPDRELWEKMAHKQRDREGRMEQLNKMLPLIEAGKEPPPRRMDVYAVMFGQEWCLVAMPHEMFCQYELWIDENAPFNRTMTFGYTNGYEGYIAVDAAWRLEEKGGYEAACLPNWGGQVWTRHFGPPAVGSEKIIKDAISSLWPKETDEAKE